MQLILREKKRDYSGLVLMVALALVATLGSLGIARADSETIADPFAIEFSLSHRLSQG